MPHQLQAVHLQAYQPPAFLVEEIQLCIELEPKTTKVGSRLRLSANPVYPQAPRELKLDGRNLELVDIALDGHLLDQGAYTLDNEGLTIADVPAKFELLINVIVNPDDNTALEGLYRSNQVYCTQCEAQGFRKITYYPDRPDVMARFVTTIIANSQSCPVLLSNGNRTDSGQLDDGRHYATFEDPFPKPSYLFALVAGRLSANEDQYTTASGRTAKLQIFVEEHNLYRCEHAMRSLKRAIRWDEETYGLELDLDEYKIVAVDDFNMGAMENKGLNIFNSKYVLADPDTATDADFQAVETVVGHEYFHNWTGNRVTCRDWFQLSLKEGLTVFRDQEFSAAMGSPAAKRIADVRLLRTAQFPEDSGPMAHPVRPESYVEINNFYTTTVYNKGAEVIRMYQTLLGEDGFRRGLKLYFARHDGQAVTTDDFLSAMADANQADLRQFQHWYSQAGTPVLDIAGEYDECAREFRLHIRQHCPDTPGQQGDKKSPFLIPLQVGLLGRDGQDLPLQLAGEDAPKGTSRVLRITVAEQTFDFVNVFEPPIPSLLRDFSAPVKVHYPYTKQQLAFLFANDLNPFNRWDAGQRLATLVLHEMATDFHNDWQPEIPHMFVDAFRAALTDHEADPALLALALSLPGETELADTMPVADPDAVHASRQLLREGLAKQLETEFVAVMNGLRDSSLYQLTPEAIGRRSLKNLCLSYLALLQTRSIATTCFDQFANANNMTDRIAALTNLLHCNLPQHEEALQAFYYRYQNDPLVVDKWFALQATCPASATLDHVQDLMGHPAFTMKNPNRVRALIGAFAHNNPVRFHSLSGQGYAFIADQTISLNKLNPQVAARLVTALSRWRRYDENRQVLMRRELERIAATKALSQDVSEIVQKSLE
ncbi:MAG: aminopeptidase N [Deltaproteobacteria bacterium]|jgi:aminopeptidase N|nr:aminopeptidase N [Deltaproteobacteria bacterium]